MKSFSTLFSLLLVILVSIQVKSAHITYSNDELKQWNTFKVKYGKEYSEEQEEIRFPIYLSNLRLINQHNLQKKSFTLKMNKFGDWTNEEYKNFLKSSSGKKLKFFGQKMIKLEELPIYGFDNKVEVDWREKGIVTPVKDQGPCGSCYTFSATGALEGQYALKYGDLLSFSEKQLVDCSNVEGNSGCNGGFVEWCYDYLINSGVMSEEDYSYKPQEDECGYDKDKVVARVSSYYNTYAGSEDALTKLIAKTGPAAIAIDAGEFSFRFYESGVYDEPNCKKSYYDLDHAVLAVGYGTDEITDKDYYIVKNSWGADWGMEGYILMKRNDNNQCGIASDVVMPVMV